MRSSRGRRSSGLKSIRDPVHTSRVTSKHEAARMAAAMLCRYFGSIRIKPGPALKPCATFALCMTYRLLLKRQACFWLALREYSAGLRAKGNCNRASLDSGRCATCAQDESGLEMVAMFTDSLAAGLSALSVRVAVMVMRVAVPAGHLVDRDYTAVHFRAVFVFELDGGVADVEVVFEHAVEAR